MQILFSKMVFLSFSDAGHVFLCEMIVPEYPSPAPAKMLDIELPVNTPGGKERTASEFAGLKLVSITPTQTPVCLLEAEVA